MSKLIYFDCYSGISGDMTLGALLDLGLKVERLQTALNSLHLDGYSLEAEKVKRGSIAGTKVRVIIEEQNPPSRKLSDIVQLISAAELVPDIKEKSILVFRCLAEAEASVHGTTVEDVHFHEVGAVDAIVDIVGSVVALHLLGINKIYCSPLPLGSGTIETAHGQLPLPAPATLALIAQRRVPVRGSNAEFELVTPTGAALVSTLAESFGPLPDFTVESVGYGAGSQNPSYPNYLRLIMGSCSETAAVHEEEAIQVETNIDDLNPEIYSYLMEKLFAAGALDVYFTPVQMKKDRPAIKLSVLIPPHLLELIREEIFTETSTLGIRLTRVRKIMRPREVTVVETKWGSIRIKFCPTLRGEQTFDYAPEYEDCCRVARLSGLPLKEVYHLADYLFRNNHQ